MAAHNSLADYYAARAREYDRIYLKPERQAELSQLELQLENTFAGAKVLELACGTGYWTGIIARSAASVVAVDINEEVLAIARSKAFHARKVRFVRADIFALPEFPEKFNGALAAFWWSHVPRAMTRAFVRNFCSRLSPGATLVLVDNNYVAGSSTPISRTDAEGNTYQTRKLEDGSTYEVLKNFPTREELEVMGAEVGTEVEVMWLEYYWVMKAKTGI